MAKSLACGSLLPPWSRYKGASKLAHSKDFAIFETDADSHFRLHPKDIGHAGMFIVKCQYAGY
jgi:hypothetical protein